MPVLIPIYQTIINRKHLFLKKLCMWTAMVLPMIFIMKVLNYFHYINSLVNVCSIQITSWTTDLLSRETRKLNAWARAAPINPSIEGKRYSKCIFFYFWSIVPSTNYQNIRYMCNVLSRFDLFQYSTRFKKKLSIKLSRWSGGFSF